MTISMRCYDRNKFLHIVLLTGILVFTQVTSLVRAETIIVLGLVADQNAIVHSQEQAEALGDYFAEHLSTTVKVRMFNDQATLHQWLVQHQEVHVAWFKDDFLAGLPAGEVLPLAQLKPLSDHAVHGQVVVRQGMDPALLQELRSVLLHMQDNVDGQDLLARLQGERFLPGEPGQPPEQPAEQASLQTLEQPSKQVLEQNIPPQEIDNFLDSLATQKVDGFRRVAVGFVVPEKHNLGGLTGTTDLSVLADIDGHFVKNLDENQIVEDGFTGQADEITLLESIRAGRSFNRESFAALARTEQAKAKTGQAFALLLPSVSIRVSSGQEKSKPSVQIDEITGELVSSDTHTRTDASFVVRQPLFDLPIFLDWRRREVIELARGENYRAVDGDAYLSTVNAYLSLASSRLQTDVTRDFEAQLAELLTYIEKRASAGASSVSDMARVKARSEETLSFRLEQESAHAAAWVEFVRLTNLAPQKVRLPGLEDVGAHLLPKSFDLAVTTAMQSNPEIASLTAELRAAKIDQSVAKGRYLPRVDAEYTYNYSLHAGGDPDSSGQRDERIMAVLNWDLFNGGRDYEYHNERTARHRELLYRLDDQRRLVIQSLSANYAVLATTRERITAGYQELTSISTAVKAMSKRMLSGNQSLLDLLDVYDRLYRARARLVSLHVLEMNTVAQLVRLTLGTPWSAPASTSPVSREKQLSSLSSEPVWGESNQSRVNRYN